MDIPKKMDAYFVEEYGGPEVLQLKEVEVPSIAENEILIEMRAASITYGDVRVRGAIYPKGLGLIGKLMMGFNGPKQPILGVDFAGIVVKVGNSVKNFTVGDRVFGIDGKKSGAYAQFKVLESSDPIGKIPSNLTFKEAAALPFGGSTAVQYLRDKGNIKKGDSILINGASGSVGSAAVQLANYFGAEVTGVCSGKNAELVTSLGAANVIDYTKQNITDIADTFDFVMDTVGNLKYSEVKHLINEGGKMLSVAGGGSVLAASIVNTNIMAGPVQETAEDITLLKKLAESRDFKPVIDTEYAFDKLVEAHEYVEKGHKVGNVILVVKE